MLIKSLTLSTLLAISLAAPAFAQVTPGSPTVGPAGGVASTTAPSNSAGTPAGGTGVISTTRVGPSSVMTAPPQNTAPMAGPTAETPTRVTRRVARPRPRARTAAQVGTQSQTGLNGSAAPSR